MTLTLIIAVVVSLVAGFAIALAFRRGTKKPELDALESRLMGRLDSLLDSVGRSRDDARTAIQEKITELYERVESQNRQARGETQQTLEQFRGTLEGYRQSLTQELKTNRDESRESLRSFTSALNVQFAALQTATEQKLTEIRGEVEKKLEQTRENIGQAFKDMSERLSELHVTNQRIVEFSKDLDELQNILKAPRLRGEVGEIEMERLLRDCLAPDQFDTQYPIEGNRVDAVIFNPQGVLPIDSKFPLEAWRRVHAPDVSEADKAVAKREFIKAVKKHIGDIAEKYIRPPETLEFAVMYIPAEGVYYEMIETPELAEHARRSRVFPASPLTFWALLQVTVIGFRGLRISEEARRISGLLAALRDDMGKFRKFFQRAATQVDDAQKNMTEASRQLDRVGSKLDTLDAERLDESTTGPLPSLPPESL